jgi:hypothetical protein
MAEPLESVTVPKMTLVAFWAHAPELSAVSKRQVERKLDICKCPYFSDWPGLRIQRYQE